MVRTPDATAPDGGIPRRSQQSVGLHPSTADIRTRLTVNNFDLLRLVLAMSVVVFHLGVLTNSPALSWLAHWVSGDIGVQGFFVVSGFLVTMSYDRGRDIRTYAIKRLRRIAPAYVAVVVGAAVLLVLLTSLPWTSYVFSAQWSAYLGWNLVLANFMAPTLPGVFEGNYKQAVNGSLWTIKIEVAFYCMVPLVAMAARWIGRQQAFLLAFTLSTVWLVGFTWLSAWSGQSVWQKLAIQAPGQFSFFVIGAIAYERTRDGLPPPPWWSAVVAVVAYAITDGLLHAVVAPLAVGVMIYWAAIGCPKFNNIARHGDISYGIYLYHWPIMQVFIALGWFKSSPVGTAIVFLMTVIGTAILSWHVVERPFLGQRQKTVASAA